MQKVFIRQAMAAEEQCMMSQETRKPKLLVVDDEPDNLDLLYRTFYRDYKVLRAQSGPAALKILANEGDVAVIISDQRMPLMSGTEFLSLTAAQYPDIIRIILTGYTDVEDLVDAINAGKVFKFVTKPWDCDQLKAVVRQAMDTYNVLKVRTSQLRQALRRETLLNSVTNTIRNAQYGGFGSSPLEQILQTIVETVGNVLEVDVCILRPFQDHRLVDEWFVYQKPEGSLPPSKEIAQQEESFFNRTHTPLYPSEESTIVNPQSPIISNPSFLVQTVWETRTVVVVNDVLTDEQFRGDDPEIKQRVNAYQKSNIRSTLVVPLISQLELMAVLALHRCGKPYVWSDDEKTLVEMVGDQAALAISQARAYEQVHALAKRQELVNTITTAIRSTLDPQKIFTAITQQLGQALKVDGCALSLWSQEDEYVQCVGLYDGKSARVLGSLAAPDSEFNSDQPEQPQTGLNPFQVPQSIAPIAGNPVLLQLLQTQQPVIIEDLRLQKELSGLNLPLRIPARALLVVPLLADGKLIGSITLRQINTPRNWNRSDIDLAQAVASQAAIAVQQSRLYQTTRQQAERLMELDRQKTEFFQNVSHEFRTPLTLMLGPLESAVRQKQDLPHAQSLIALRNSRRLLRLVNQLLDLQRLDDGRMQASFCPCNLVEVVSQIVEVFHPYCEKRRLGISTQLTSCAEVYLDLEKFDKVIYNLLSNAVKFTEAGGNITITVEPVTEQVRMQVTDTGIGIKKEQIPHLFERFRQASGSVSRSYEGSGLGLALVKELVELHGGQVSVESVYSQGTTFTVLLPMGSSHLPPEQVVQIPTEIQSARAAIELAELELESTLLAEDKSNNGEQEGDAQMPEGNPLASILVVDDNSDLRAYVSGILQLSGYRVWLARDGEEGFRLAQKHLPQLIVTDLMMPGVSGLDLISLIRNQPQLQGIPVVLLTAKADEGTRIEGTEVGADAYLSKPFNDRELLAEVRNLLALKANEQKVLDLNNYLTESVLKRFLPPIMVQKAAKGELVLDWSPETRQITVLFSDIVGFTKLANKLQTHRIAELLNEYLEAMTDAVFDHSGTLDKFMGDGILAIFGAPEELSALEQVQRSIAAARQMHRSLRQLNQNWQRRGLVEQDGSSPVRFRCGIHQGVAVVGMLGGSKRSDYTAIGPCVNIASRLQEAAEPNSILVSADVANLLDKDDIIKSRTLQLKGIDGNFLSFAVKETED